MEFLHRDDCRDLLLRQKLKQVHNRSSTRSSASLRDRISLEAINTSAVREEQNVIVRLRQQQILNVILINRLHSADSLSTTVLTAEIIHTHALNVSELRDCDNSVLIRDQILHRHVKLVKSDRGLSVIAVFLRDRKNLLADHAEQFLLICEDRPEFLDARHQLAILILNLLSLKTGQRTQTHIDDRLSLNIAELKFLHQLLFCNLRSRCTADNLNHLVDVVESNQQTFEDMSALLRLI